MSNLRPTLCVGSVVELSPEALRQEIPNLGGVAFDLDKTLLGQHELGVPEEHIAALWRISAEGLDLGIISNASSKERTERVQAIAGGLGVILDMDISVTTSRMVGGKKKPLRPVFDAMSETMGLDNDQLCYVGDQLFKDVLGANRAGYGGTVLVAPFGRGDDPWVKYLQRPIESAIRPWIGLPFRTQNFGN